MIDVTRIRKLPLRDVVNHLEHRCRELMDHLQADLNPTVAELHKLTRPTRKKSAYPSLRIVCNVVERLRRSSDYADKLGGEIEECVRAVEDRAGSH